MSKKRKTAWESTGIPNLVRDRRRGTFYVRVRVGGKQKWRSLETDRKDVAKLRHPDVEGEIRAQGLQTAAPGGDTTVGAFVAALRRKIQQDASLTASTKERKESAIKAILKTWPELSAREAHRVTSTECQTWAANALREGTGFIAPNVKTVRKGMSASAFNKCIDALRAIFETARARGVIHRNPAGDLTKAPAKRKRLDLPTPQQFKLLVKEVATGGARWSQDCADLVRLLTYSGARLREATALRWGHLDTKKNQITIPGRKTESSYRIVPLFPALGALLAEIRARRGYEPPDAPIARVGGCLGALESACQTLGLKILTHHDLRHLFSTMCIESQADIPTVSRWLGHSDGGALAMKTYGHLRQEHSQAQAAKMVFFGGSASQNSSSKNKQRGQRIRPNTYFGQQLGPPFSYPQLPSMDASGGVPGGPS